MFLVYESYYNEIVLNIGESTNIVGLYDSKEKAIKKAKELIKESMEEDNYVLDVENDNIEKDNYVIMFWENQENWNCYYEIYIKEIGVE